LRPGGKALLGDEEIVKPAARGADDWSHHYHGPDNNPQSGDKLARAPYLTQFVAEPRYGPAPQAAVAAGGRVFMAFGHVAWHEREEPWMDTLVALNGYNGTHLWKRAVPKGIMVDRATMVATPTTLYLGDANSCKLLDAATGEAIGEITAPSGLVGGSFWKWMALEDGVLYALVGKDEDPDAQARWRRRQHGWPWGGISNGYNAPKYAWGFAATLLAIDPKTNKVLWHHKETAAPMDSRATCMKAGRLFVTSFGKYIACLDAKTGKEIWRKTPDDDSQLFTAIGEFSPGHGYRTGWKSTVYLRCTDKALYFMGPQLRSLTAASAEDGRLLWSLPLESKVNVHLVIRPEGLYTIGGQKTEGETRKLDPMTGEVLATYQVSRRACTRATGSPDGILFRASGGSVRLDTATGKPQWISPMRPSCLVGVVIANGHLYWQPWTCDCSLQLFGAICVGPAGDFAFGAEAADAERLDLVSAETAAERKETKPPARGGRGAADWATYLGNNQRAAQTEWGALNVPEQAGQLW
ncbi:MAG: PQQ-binding-like beta-propeller repeat protein, partial [Phycisphaerae bacterium]